MQADYGGLVTELLMLGSPSEIIEKRLRYCGIVRIW